MHRLIYISSTRTPFSASDLETILTISRRNNAAVGVTGLLVAGGRRFLQVLEGSEDAIERVFQRIRQDNRHHAIVTLSKSEIDAPSFGEWSMGYVAGSAAAGSAATLPETVARLLEPVTDPTIRGYFEGFAALHAAA